MSDINFYGLGMYDIKSKKSKVIQFPTSFKGEKRQPETHQELLEDVKKLRDEQAHFLKQTVLGFVKHAFQDHSMELDFSDIKTQKYLAFMQLILHGLCYRYYDMEFPPYNIVNDVINFEPHIEIKDELIPVPNDDGPKKR